MKSFCICSKKSLKIPKK